MPKCSKIPPDKYFNNFGYSDSTYFFKALLYALGTKYCKPSCRIKVVLSQTMFTLTEYSITT